VFQKNPIKVIDREETDSDVDIMDNGSDEISQASSLEKKQLHNVKHTDVKFHISVSDEKEGKVMPTTLALTDITKPLSIQTKFGNLPTGPGTGSSTDTASEIGSCLSSPVCSTGQPSPNVMQIKTSPHITTPDGKTLKEPTQISEGINKISLKSDDVDVRKMENKDVDGATVNESPESAKKRKRKFGSHQGFTPKVQSGFIIQKIIKINLKINLYQFVCTFFNG
jgi:hypothetical protein